MPSTLLILRASAEFLLTVWPKTLVSIDFTYREFRRHLRESQTLKRWRGIEELRKETKKETTRKLDKKQRK